MNPFNVLGAPPTATTYELRRAYLRRVRETHPDLGGTEAQVREVIEAWTALWEPGQRVRYAASYKYSTSSSQEPSQPAPDNPATPAPQLARVAFTLGSMVAIIASDVRFVTVLLHLITPSRSCNKHHWRPIRRRSL